MSDIIKYALMITIINSYFLVWVSSTNLPKTSFQGNESKVNEKKKTIRLNQTSIKNLAAIDYNFFSYDVVDHNTLLIKFDLASTIFFQRSKLSYHAYLYVSKIPTSHYEINVGSFTGYYEKEIEGTITDHFVLCLVLIPNNTNRNQTKTIFHKYFQSTSRKQKQQHILHYCTRMGPDEDAHRHHKKQGSQGDHILLLLQLMMIGIFLLVIQIAHMKKARKAKKRISEYLNRIRHEHLTHKDSAEFSHETLRSLGFATINEELSREVSEEENKSEEGIVDDDDDEEETKETFLTVSQRRSPSPISRRKRTRSPPPPSFASIEDEQCENTSVEHILETKPWLNIPK